MPTWRGHELCANVCGLATYAFWAVPKGENGVERAGRWAKRQVHAQRLLNGKCPSLAYAHR